LELAVGTTLLLEPEPRFAFKEFADGTFDARMPVGLIPLIRAIGVKNINESVVSVWWGGGTFSSLFFRTVTLVVDIILRQVVSVAKNEESTDALSAASIRTGYNVFLRPLFGEFPNSSAFPNLGEQISATGIDTFFRADVVFPLQEEAKEDLICIACVLIDSLITNAFVCLRSSEYFRWRSAFIFQALTLEKSSGGRPKALCTAFRHCLLKHLESSPQATISVLGLLMRKDLGQFYIPIMRSMYLFSVQDIVQSISHASKREKLRLLAAFRDVAGKLDGPQEKEKEKEKEKENEEEKKEVKSSAKVEMPVDPCGWIKLETERRKQFALPTASLPEEILQHPMLELYMPYSALSLYERMKKPVHLASALVDELLLTHSWRGQMQKADHPRKRSIASYNKFVAHWQMCSHGQFEGVDMSNIFIAGGSVLSCMLPECSYENLGASDIDCFVYGLSPEQATTRVLEVVEAICNRRAEIKARFMRSPFDPKNSPYVVKAFRKVANPGLLTAPPVLAKSLHALTLAGDEIFRPVQFIMRAYRSPAEVLLGFDVDCCAVGLSLGDCRPAPAPAPALKYPGPNEDPKALECPISLEIMDDPVQAADGQTYDRRNIEDHLTRSNISPITNEKLTTTELTIDSNMRRRIEVYCQEKAAAAAAAAAAPTAVPPAPVSTGELPLSLSLSSFHSPLTSHLLLSPISSAQRGPPRPRVAPPLLLRLLPSSATKRQTKSRFCKCLWVLGLGGP
jgi:hypothetical protein